jgi:hypothetical protein
MGIKSDVSDSEISSLFQAATMPDLGHARWKIDFFATHGLDPSRAISSLCPSLRWELQGL